MIYEVRLRKKTGRLKKEITEKKGSRANSVKMELVKIEKDRKMIKEEKTPMRTKKGKMRQKKWQRKEGKW